MAISGTGTAPPTTTTPPKPAATCSCCSDSLECFEKPRFFCGQLLTDVDLEAAMNYVAAKNRLHNRYLFGAGVVCGLAVRCDPCDAGSVVIEPGYALDCNGNDVIVCADKPFDVKGYLDRRKKEKQTDCFSQRTAGCVTTQTEYCLVLSYEEKPGKPVNALVRDNGCKANTCEPSRTLERFRVDLIDKETAEKLNVRPSVWSRMRECLQDEGRKLTAYQGEIANAANEQQLRPVYERMRTDLLAFAKRSSLAHCDLIDKVCAIDKDFRVPVTSQPAVPNSTTAGWTDLSLDNQPVLREVANRLSALYARLLMDCICNALMVPCGGCCEDSDYVLLACLEIKDNKVTSICNTVRTQVISGPAIRYWMQPAFDVIGQWFESLCCPGATAQDTVRDFGAFYDRTTTTGRTAQSFASGILREVETMFTAPRSATIVRSIDLVGRPANEVMTALLKSNVTVVTTNTTLEQAYRRANLRDLPDEIPAASRVELVVAPDGTVATIRILGNVVS
jgi:hypothetical protein